MKATFFGAARDALFETRTLVLTGKVARIPVVLHGIYQDIRPDQRDGKFVHHVGDRHGAD